MGQPPSDPAKTSTAEESAALDELRRLLLAPEQKQLAEVQATIQDPQLHAQAVGLVLPEAVLLANQRDQRLGRALAPTIETALKESIQRDPAPLAEAIFPIIGPAIRKSIAALFRELTQSFNRTLEHSLSVRGFGWRWEAWRTGKSFAEVVLARTLVYQVEQVLLIHNETSLLLAEVRAARTETRDADQVSAMLAAIQDFMRDSFRTDRKDGLNTVEFGELTLWLEHGPRATLVAAIRGHAPESLRPRLQQTLEDLHASHAAALTGFSGDNARFADLAPALERCLVMEQHGATSTKTSPRLLWVLLGCVGLLVVGLLVWRDRQARVWQDFRDELAQTEGIVLTEAAQLQGRWYFRGLRDPLSMAPAEVLARHPLPTNHVVFQFTPFWSLSPGLVLQRATQRLAPPPGVTLRLEGETLVAEGSAPAAWLDSARALAPMLPGINRLNTAQLLDSSQQALAEARRRVEAVTLFFTEGSGTAVTATNVLDHLATEITALVEAAGRQRVQVEVRGHADRQGTPEVNQRIAGLRAQSVATALQERGVPAKILRAVNRSTQEAGPERANPRDRRVTLHVEVGPP